MSGLDRLRRVRERLCGEGGDARERLQAAGCEFLLAAVGREAWPAGLRAEAERVRAGLLTVGVADGDVREADEAEVEWLTHDLLRLCERGERCFRRWPTRMRHEPVLC